MQQEKCWHEAVEAFVNEDAPAAQKVIDKDDEVDDFFNEIKDEMITIIKAKEQDADKVVDVLMMAKYLEKIGDHAVNIGEWTIFQKTGDIESVRIL